MLFSSLEGNEGHQVLVNLIFEDFINLYLKIGAKQPLKDFKQDFLLKKTFAHRQMVLIRTEKKQKKKTKVELSAFRDDRSEGKSDSHLRLKSSISQFGDAYLWTVYTVPEIKKLCAAYNVQVPSKVTRKCEIAKLLLPVVKNAESIPFSDLLDDYRVTTSVYPGQSESGPLVLRIVRVK